MRGRTASTSTDIESEQCDICTTFGEEYIRAQKLGELERAELVRLVLDGHKQTKHPWSNRVKING